MVHIGLDLGERGGIDCARLREIEAQAFGRDEAALLRDVQAEALAERFVQQVGGAMVGADAVAARAVDRQVQRIADRDRSFGDRGAVRPEAAEIFVRVLDLAEHAGCRQRAGITDLPAAFGVERRLVDDDLDGFAGRCGVDPRAILDDRDDLALAFFRRIADEFGAARAFGNVEPDIVRGALARSLPRGAGGALLFGHRGIEPGAIDPEALRAEGVLGQVIREAERVVELERGFAGERSARFHRGGGFIEQAQTVDERAAELRFLLQQRRFDRGLRADELGVCRAHFGNQRGDQPVHQRLLRAEQMRVPHRAAHDATQHIATTLIGGQHAVRNEEPRGAQMIGDDAVARLIVARRGGAGERAGSGDQRLERVGVIIVVDALQHRRDPLQPHAGVDRRLGQRRARAVGRLVELHEDEVPDLDEAIAILIRAARRATGDMVAMIEKDLRARPARPGVPHRPEIVVGGDADDALLGEPRNPLPQIERFVIGVIDGDGQPVRVDPPFLGQQPPGERDRALLEIIAEREIAEHFEEGVVARSIADIVEIVMLAPGPHAFLARRRGDIGPRFEAGEDVLKRHHPGIDEHQRRVVLRHQRRGGDLRMAVRREIIEEAAADVVRGNRELGHGRRA